MVLHDGQNILTSTPRPSAAPTIAAVEQVLSEINDRLQGIRKLVPCCVAYGDLRTDER
jgi:hypothetical protein